MYIIQTAWLAAFGWTTTCKDYKKRPLEDDIVHRHTNTQQHVLSINLKTMPKYDKTKPKTHWHKHA